MALIKCPECQHDVSEHAVSCPSCGYGIKEYLSTVQEQETDNLAKEDIETEDGDECYEEEYDFSPEENNYSIETKSDTKIKMPSFSVATYILIATLLIVLCYKCSSFSGLGSDYRDTKCDWCSKEEECKQYCVQSLDGYNRDGSFKYDYEYLWFSDSCYKDAKNQGVKYGWINIYEAD